MRGAIGIAVGRYGPYQTQKAYASAVMRRYMAMRRLTALSRDEVREAEAAFFKAVRRRDERECKTHPCLDNAVLQTVFPSEFDERGGEVWIDGREYLVTHDQLLAIQALRSMARKVSRHGMAKILTTAPGGTGHHNERKQQCSTKRSRPRRPR